MGRVFSKTSHCGFGFQPTELQAEMRADSVYLGGGFFWHQTNAYCIQGQEIEVRKYHGCQRKLRRLLFIPSGQLRIIQELIHILLFSPNQNNMNNSRVTSKFIESTIYRR